MSTIISDCEQYRYRLTRDPHDLYTTRGPAFFVMLNPSVADSTIHDATIRRCRGFAKSWDCTGIVVANLYALRATDPAELWRHKDPVGPDNDAHLASLFREHETIVCAWGSNAKADRVAQVIKMFHDREHATLPRNDEERRTTPPAVCPRRATTARLENAMKERATLFSAPMARAFIEANFTHEREIVRPV